MIDTENWNYMTCFSSMSHPTRLPKFSSQLSRSYLMGLPGQWISQAIIAATSLFLAAPFCSGAVAAERSPVKSLLEMRREQVTIQKWDLSCGAAALTTLLRYQYGDLVTEKEVATVLINRSEYIANPLLVQLREGFSLLDLKRYVDGRGYHGVGYGNLTLDDLKRRAPILVPIRTFGYNHFVVFRGQLGNRVLLADPAWGNRTMTVARFEDAWIDYPKIGHVGFVVEPTPNRPQPTSGLLAPKPDDFVTFN